jgi:PAS domain S-box-containing protein
VQFRARVSSGRESEAGFLRRTRHTKHNRRAALPIEMMLDHRITKVTTEPPVDNTVSRIALWLANTLNCVADGLLATNSCGEVLFMNSRAEQLTGWSVEEALRQSSSRVFNVVKPTCGTKLDSPLREAYVEEQVLRSGDCLLVAAAGDRIPIDFSAAPIRTEEGEVVGAVVLFRERNGN